MKIFLSWSGEKSKAIGLVLKDWLKDVIQQLDPWMSDEDIKKGVHWSPEIAKELKVGTVGIVCLTRENLNEPWILFEAGALSKAVEESYVCTFLYNLEKTDIQGPLAQFQATSALDKNDVRKLLHTLNGALKEGKLEKDRLDRIFDLNWNILDAKLKDIPVGEEISEPERTSEEKINEILVTVRTIQQQQEERLPVPLKLQPGLIGNYYYMSSQPIPAGSTGLVLGAPGYSGFAPMGYLPKENPDRFEGKVSTSEPVDQSQVPPKKDKS